MIKKFFDTLQEDKKKHCIGGFIISFACLYDLFLGSLLVHIIAFGKEMYDGYKPDKHTMEFNDYFATIAGHSFFMLLYSIFI